MRPNKIQVLGRLTIENYATRPAAEWGAEYSAFPEGVRRGPVERDGAACRGVKSSCGNSRCPAWPRRTSKAPSGSRLETLHPYGEDEVVWGWSSLGFGGVLVGIVLRSTIERYVGMFVEAGIAVRSFTFSAAAVHAAIRLNGGGTRGRLRGA